MQHYNLLRFHRKKWALTQSQLSDLLALKSRSMISKHELGPPPPGFTLALAYQFLYGAPLEDLFPSLIDQVEELIMTRACHLDEAMRDAKGASADRVREFLQELVGRVRSLERV